MTKKKIDEAETEQPTESPGANLEWTHELIDKMSAPAAPADERKTIEYWRDELKTPDWLFAGLKLGKDWPIGKEVTRETYEEAADWAANVPCR